MRMSKSKNVGEGRTDILNFQKNESCAELC